MSDADEFRDAMDYALCTGSTVKLLALFERLMAERDAAEARVTLLEGSLRKAAERLEARGHHFGAERARAALTALPQVPQSTASPDDQEGEKK